MRGISLKLSIEYLANGIQALLEQAAFSFCKELIGDVTFGSIHPIRRINWVL